MSTSRIIIQYYVQNDSWESLKEPNLVSISAKNNNVTVQNVYDAFPLLVQKLDNFYLRFYLEDQITGAKVWIDLPSNAAVPVYNEKIYVKALRLPNHVKLSKQVLSTKKVTNSNSNPTNTNNNIDLTKSKSVNNDNANDTNLRKENRTTPTQSQPQSNSKSQSKYQEKVEINSNVPHHQKHNSRQENTNDNRANFNMNSINDMSKSKSKSPEKDEYMNNKNIFSSLNLDENEQDGDFLFTNTTNSKISSKNEETTTNNIFNNIGDIFFEPAVNSNNKSDQPRIPNINIPTNIFEPINNNETNSGTGNFPNIDFTNQGLNQPTQKAKSTNNISSQYAIDKVNLNGLSDDQIKKVLDPIIDNWSTNHNERKNLCVFLSTLKEIWTHENYWKEVNLIDLLDKPELIRKHYKTARTQLHPDKNQNVSFKTKYIAERLFFILSKVYDEHKF